VMCDELIHASVTDATGLPAAVMTWSKQNDAGSRFPNGTVLRFPQVALSHIGVYTCTPVNEVGAAQSASITLNVIGELVALITACKLTVCVLWHGLAVSTV